MRIKKHKSGINVKKLAKRNDSKEKMVEKIADFLEMPQELLSNNSKVTLIDNKYFYLESNNQILDYYDHYIKIKTSSVTITLDGKKMEIKEISDKEVVIQGEILNVSLGK